MKKNIVPFTQAEERFIHQMIEKRTRAGQSHPLIFGLCVTFGLVATLTGFERIIDQIDLLANNPWILLATGLAVLVATGAAYQKLN